MGDKCKPHLLKTCAIVLFAISTYLIFSPSAFVFCLSFSCWSLNCNFFSPKAEELSKPRRQVSVRCANLSVWEHSRSQTGRCWGEDLKLEHVMLSMGVGGGCNTSKNAGSIYGWEPEGKQSVQRTFPITCLRSRVPRNGRTGLPAHLWLQCKTEAPAVLWGQQVHPWKTSFVGWRSSQNSSLNTPRLSVENGIKPLTLENLGVFHYRRCLITHYCQFQELRMKKT